MWTVGLTLGGRYRLDAMLGVHTGSGVWAATHLATGARVAIRPLLAPELTPEEVERVVAEIRHDCAIGHPNILHNEVVSGLAEAPCIVSELLDGETLAERLVLHPMLSLHDTASLLLPVVSAVGTAHARGIVHGQLTASSIFVCDVPVPSVKVLDFGLGRWSAATRRVPASVRGPAASAWRSSPYAAPEEALPGRTLDHRADIWALGVILYQCASGLRPSEFVPPERAFADGSARFVPIEQRVPGLPKVLTDVIADLLVSDPEHRAQNLIELYHVLGRFADGASPGFGWPGSERRITGLTQHLPVPVRPPALPAPAAAPPAQPAAHSRWRTLALVASAVAAAEFVLLTGIILRAQRLATPAGASEPAAVLRAATPAASLSNGSPSEALAPLAASGPGPFAIDDFEDGDDVPLASAFSAWQPLASAAPGGAQRLALGPGSAGGRSIGLPLLASAGQGSTGPLSVGIGAAVRSAPVDLSGYAALEFTSRRAPPPAPECRGSWTVVAFVRCQASPGSVRQLELATPVSDGWAQARVPLAALRPAGAPGAPGEIAVCLSSVAALGFRADVSEDGDAACRAGRVWIDDVVLR